MENSNYYNDFEGFSILLKYTVTMRYKEKPDLENQKFIENFDGYDIYTTNNIAYVYVIKDEEEFYGLAQLNFNK